MHEDMDVLESLAFNPLPLKKIPAFNPLPLQRPVLVWKIAAGVALGGVPF